MTDPALDAALDPSRDAAVEWYKADELRLREQAQDADSDPDQRAAIMLRYYANRVHRAALGELENKVPEGLGRLK